MDKVKVRSGQKVLIYGASSGLGTAAVQLANCFGAEVTGACGTADLEMVSSLGAQTVLDYSAEDFAIAGNQYNVILNALEVTSTAPRISFRRCKHSLAPNGTYLSFVIGLPILFQTLWTSVFGAKKAQFSATALLPISKRPQFLHGVIPILSDKRLKPVVDRH
jgi:NADPH:quinone reductase-like Zn-dependent oxidoreductase